MTAIAAIAVAIGWYLRRPDDWLILHARLGAPAAGRFDWQSARSRAIAAIAGTALVSTAVPNAATQAALVAFAATGVGAATLRRQAVVRRQAVEFRAEIARILSSVAAELRAGVDPFASLRAALADAPDAWDAVRMAPFGDVAPALRAMSSLPGGEGLAEVAAAWHIAEQTGSPLASVLDRLSASMRAEVELDRDVAIEAAPARATGRLMALLPVAGLGLGMLLGANPVWVLVSTWPGVACLGGGLALAWLGVWRIERIVAEVEAR